MYLVALKGNQHFESGPVTQMDESVVRWMNTADMFAVVFFSMIHDFVTVLNYCQSNTIPSTTKLESSACKSWLNVKDMSITTICFVCL